MKHVIIAVIGDYLDRCNPETVAAFSHQEEATTQPLNLSARTKQAEPLRSPTSPTHGPYSGSKSSPTGGGKGRIPSPMAHVSRNTSLGRYQNADPFTPFINTLILVLPNDVV